MWLGELGWELFHNRADTLRLYEAIMAKVKFIRIRVFGEEIILKHQYLNFINFQGAQYGIVNFGMKTLNTLRIENGYKLWGREVGSEFPILAGIQTNEKNGHSISMQLSLNKNAYEAGVSSLIDMSKPDFIGKAACAQFQSTTPERRLSLGALLKIII